MPYPANYGGIIDVYHMLRALRRKGVYVILHTYLYGARRKDDRILDVADEVYYYPRHLGLSWQFSSTPYIVASRCDRTLLHRLLSDPSPVLLEGLHTCWLLRRLREAGKFVAVRTHNVEHHYYAGLSRSAISIKDKLFFTLESWRLQRYQRVLKHASAIFAISPADTEYFSNAFPGIAVSYVPPFFDDSRVDCSANDGPDLLYHGNLEVAENADAATYLASEIVPLLKSGARLTVAGSSPPPELCRLLNEKGVNVIINPSDRLLDTLIVTAKINILVTRQATGMKLKLMKVLNEGNGYCLVNPTMLSDTQMARYCIVAEGKKQFAETIDWLVTSPRNADEALLKRKAFRKEYGTDIGARKICESMGFVSPSSESVTRKE